MTNRLTCPVLAALLSGSLLTGAVAAQDGALDSDPYFSRGAADPYASQPAPAAPPRTSQGQTERAAPRALPRPRTGGETFANARPAFARQAAATPTSVPDTRGRRGPDASAITGYLEARTGWDGPRGAARDDGILLGVTGGFDLPLAEAGGGVFYAGLFGAVDLSSARRTAASVARDESGENPVLTLTETPLSETRDLELGARLGWRGRRLGLYVMTALSNRKRETETVTTTFTELADPDDAEAVIFTQDAVERSGEEGLFADGWRVGAGAEARIAGPAYVHVGYRYSDYGDDGEKHQVLTGVGARF